MLFDNNRKPFEVPETGFYIGVLADIVDVGEVLTNFGKKFQTRFVWLLDKKDSEGNPYQAIRQMSATLFAGPPESKLHDTVKSVLGTTPPVPFDGENLIGKCNKMYIEKITTAKGKDFANIKIILPLETAKGEVPIPVPADFVRAQNREKKTPGPMAAPAAQLPQQAVQNKPPVNLNAPVTVGVTDNTSF